MKALHEYLSDKPFGHRFTIYDICPEASTDPKVLGQLRSAVALYCRPSKKRLVPCLSRSGVGTYVYKVALPFPRSYKSRKVSGDKPPIEKPEKKKVLSPRQIAQEDMKKHDMESPEQPDTRSLQDSLSKLRVSKGVLDLLVNNKITFKVELVCSNVERNFQDEITRFSIESINVSVANVD